MSQFGIQLHSKSKTKRYGNGKRKLKFRDKRKSEIGNYFSATKMSTANEEKDTRKAIRRRGGARTHALKRAAFAVVLLKGKYQKSRIKGVLESRDNRNFARQNIITKGTVINTELGKAVVINRPGKEGDVKAKLIEG